MIHPNLKITPKTQQKWQRRFFLGNNEDLLGITNAYGTKHRNVLTWRPHQEKWNKNIGFDVENVYYLEFH